MIRLYATVSKEEVLAPLPPPYPSSRPLSDSSELFWDFFRGYFLFPREERKNSSDLSFDSSEVSVDSSEEIFLSSLGNGK